MSSAEKSETDASADVALNRLTAAFMRLLAEHWVQSEKLENLINLLGHRKLVDPEELERIGSEMETDSDRDQKAADFVRRILDPLREPSNKNIKSQIS